MASSIQIRKNKASHEQVTDIQDLKPWNSTWLVHVKVLHSWKQNIKLSGETMEFILADENGHKIHATCKRTYIESKGKLLAVGDWRNIKNFQITPAGGAYRSTNHMYKIVFNQNTTITRSNHQNDELYLTLVDFQTVLSGTLNDNFLIDVLGQVLDCGEVETVQCTGGKQRKKLEFTLRDINDSRLPCCIWGNFAELLYTACNEEDGIVTLVLRFAKLGKFRGELQISNAFDASQMLINPSIPEAEAFKDMYNGEETALTSFQSTEGSQEENLKQLESTDKRAQKDKWLLFPTKNIEEMIASRQVERCLVMCYVYAINMDWSWYYFGCNACNKRVLKVGTKVRKVNGIEITTHIWWCETCKDNVLTVSPRFWLHLIVKDETGVAKLMILDKVANGIVAESPTKLLNGSWDELEDPSLIPDAITDLVGKTFTFGVYIENDNISYGAEIYKVGKIYKDRMMCLTDGSTSCQSDKALTITSHDETSVSLSDSHEITEVISTPSTKRKEDTNGILPDISSTSKKACTRTIKIEKLESAASKSKKTT